MLYSYTRVGSRDEDGHLSCCDEDVLHSPLRCCAVLSTPLLLRCCGVVFVSVKEHHILVEGMVYP